MVKTLQPKEKMPSISVDTLSGNSVTLGSPQDNKWQLILVYRGVHCPICESYLTKLEELKDKIEQLGVEIIVVSADTQEQAQNFKNKINTQLEIGYGLNEDTMKQLGLFISQPLSSQETHHTFPEPGLFVVNENKEIQIIDISNAPFSRPDLDMIVSGIEFVQEKNYPIRGTYSY